MMSWGFLWSAETTRAVRDGEIRADAPAPYRAVTRLWVHNQTRDGALVRAIVRDYPAGTTIYLEEPTPSGRFASFRTLAAPAETWPGGLDVPVALISASPEGLAPGPVDALFLRAAAPSTRAAAIGPDLVTLVDAKQHLRIVDGAHDPDVQQKVTAASATIRDYLKGQNDPAWTPLTVPPWIAAAVLLLLTHLYEHRGDAFGPAQDNDDRVWEAIANLLRRSRDPALA